MKPLDKNFVIDFEVDKAWRWVEEVFPLARSLMNEDYKKTLFSIEKEIGSLDVHRWQSGKIVGNWEIPKNWIVRQAFIGDVEGNKLIDFDVNSMHLASYSISIDKELSFEELRSHLYYSHKMPGEIPYITFYYERNWAFCLTKAQYEILSGYERLRVLINTEFVDDELVLGEHRIVGRSKRQINFNTYICHPAMANNELSGTSVALILIAYLKHLKSTKGLQYTYNFYWGAETIGAIALLSDKYDEFKNNLLAGYVLTCIGDEARLGFVSSRAKRRLSEKILRKVLIKRKQKFNVFPFSHRGSDERQFCWPGVDLPYTCVFKSKFECYDQYHTTGDNLKFISKKGIKESAQLLINVINEFEKNRFPKCCTIGEPHLSRYMHYSKMGKTGPNPDARLILDILNLCDGETTELEIARLLNTKLSMVEEIVDFCIENKLLESC